MSKGLVIISDAVYRQQHALKPRGKGTWSFQVHNGHSASSISTFVETGKYHEVKNALRKFCRENQYTHAELMPLAPKEPGSK